MRQFVIVVDMQADFVRRDGALPVPGAEELVERTNGWLAELRAEKIAGVLFTFDTHLADVYPNSPEALQFPPHCYLGTPGWEAVLDIDAVDGAIPSYRLNKGVFDMWAEPHLTVDPIHAPGFQPTDRDRFFADLRARGVGEVSVIGVAADYCVRWAIDGLVARGFRVTVPAHLTRGIEREVAAVAEEIGSPNLQLA